MFLNEEVKDSFLAAEFNHSKDDFDRFDWDSSLAQHTKQLFLKNTD